MKSSITEPGRAIRRWLREPLVHFTLLGALIFGAYGWLNQGASGGDASRKIVLTDDDLLQMVVVWRAQGRPPPTPAQMQGMIDAKVREEVLYREARAMGLDNDDMIVKRRLGQKMDFLAEDLSLLREPTHDELVAWLKAHPQDFATPSRTSFHHLYYSFDKREGNAQRAAGAAAAKLANRRADASAPNVVADQFMFQDRYVERTSEQIAAVFGDPFLRGVSQLQPGAWSQPIESAFGWHLVYVDERTPARAPDFEEIEPALKTAWSQAQREELKRQAYAVMRAKYEVVLPPTATDQGAAPTDGKPVAKKRSIGNL